MLLIQSQDGMPTTHRTTAERAGIEPTQARFRASLACQQTVAHQEPSFGVEPNPPAYEAGAHPHVLARPGATLCEAFSDRPIAPRALDQG